MHFLTITLFVLYWEKCIATLCRVFADRVTSINNKENYLNWKIIILATFLVDVSGGTIYKPKDSSSAVDTLSLKLSIVAT